MPIAPNIWAIRDRRCAGQGADLESLRGEPAGAIALTAGPGDRHQARQHRALREPGRRHFSVVDQAGNAVANTYTLNFCYGLGLVADGIGILLNNELDDFAARPGVANAYGLIGGAANQSGPASAR